jgi:hypothetical protein
VALAGVLALGLDGEPIHHLGRRSGARLLRLATPRIGGHAQDEEVRPELVRRGVRVVELHTGG